MKKIILIISSLLLANCAYKPILDSKGRSGKWNEARATEMTDDLQSCEYQAKKYTNTALEVSKKGYNLLIRPKLLWLSPKAQDKYKQITVNCLESRGHAVLNK
jgi:hypothetical protein